jgi:hypothetical protein
MANHELKVGDVVRILKPKLYSGYEPYPERFIGMVGIVQRIAPDQQYPYYIASSDPTVMNIGFLRGELKWVKDYILPNPIEERIKRLREMGK